MSPYFDGNALPLLTPVTHNPKSQSSTAMSTRSATTSSSSSTNSSNPYQPLRTPGDVPTAVKQLLASTKDLQAVLKQWSLREATETDVSNIFVKVGTEFHATIDAFAYHGINLNHINTFIEDLRGVLEQCLAEEPTPGCLSQFMPEVRRVFYTLLKGLQARQAAWQSATGKSAFMTGDERP